MAGIVYPGFTADEPTLAGRAMVTAVDAAAQRSLLGFDFIPADDSAVVHLADAETVTGQKTFNQPLRIETQVVVGGSLWLGVIENGIDKFGYRDIDNGDLYIAAKSPLSRALRIIPSDSDSGDVAFRSNGSAYAFRNYLGNYAIVQASTLDNPSAALILGNATYGVTVQGPLTAGSATFSGNTLVTHVADDTAVPFQVTGYSGNNLLSLTTEGYGGTKLAMTLGSGGRSIYMQVKQTGGGKNLLQSAQGLLIATGGTGLLVDDKFASGYNLATQIGDNLYGMKVGASGTGPLTAGATTFIP